MDSVHVNLVNLLVALGCFSCYFMFTHVLYIFVQLWMWTPKKLSKASAFARELAKVARTHAGSHTTLQVAVRPLRKFKNP